MSEYKLSEDADYLAQANCFMRGDFAGAITHLKQTLGRVRAHGSAQQAAHLRVMIGRKLHMWGRRDEAEAEFSAADDEARLPSQIRYFIASFYAEHGEDQASTVRWQKKVLDSTVPSEVDQSHDGEALKYDRYYKLKAAEFLAKISPGSIY